MLIDNDQNRLFGYFKAVVEYPITKLGELFAIIICDALRRCRYLTSEGK